MKKFVTLGVLGAAMLGVSPPAHADAHAQADTDPAGGILAPAWNVTKSAETTACQQDLSGLPVVSQYAGVVSGVCNSKGALSGNPHS
ncbi:hypothetical protein [Streptomyces sp. NPDC053079]|uniref:hypothetical protein n=1 Tax=Streptomyces sp. NPDC053079 TaxID=3365697 RepID=UPI0037CFCE14